MGGRRGEGGVEGEEGEAESVREGGGGTKGKGCMNKRGMGREGRGER